MERILLENGLFEGMSGEETEAVLQCMGAKSRKYGKRECILQSGDVIRQIGILLSGEAQITKEDMYGNKNIVARLEGGDMFGEAFCCARVEGIPYSIWTTGETEILYLDYKKVITTCPSSCSFHNRLIENMLYILAVKNVLLTQKIEILSRRNLREKVLAFLQQQSAGRERFVIPFSRQEMADYLCVDRSALSRKLCKLKEEGIVDFNRNKFYLKIM